MCTMSGLEMAAANSYNREAIMRKEEDTLLCITLIDNVLTCSRETLIKNGFVE